MSDPDVIWSYAKFDGARIFHKKPNIPDMPTEYRRADLPPTDAEVMNHPKVHALVDALEEAAQVLNQCTWGVMYVRGRYVDRKKLVENYRAALAELTGGKDE